MLPACQNIHITNGVSSKGAAQREVSVHSDTRRYLRQNEHQCRPAHDDSLHQPEPNCVHEARREFARDSAREGG